MVDAVGTGVRGDCVSATTGGGVSGGVGEIVGAIVVNTGAVKGDCVLGAILGELVASIGTPVTSAGTSVNSVGTSVSSMGASVTGLSHDS